jgi:hypothetical protein
LVLVLVACGGGTGGRGGGDAGRDAAVGADGAGGASGEPDAAGLLGVDIVDSSLTYAVLPADVAAAAAVPVAEGETVGAGATPYEVVMADVTAASATPDSELRPARALTLRIRWGYIPPATTPATLTTWHDLGGYLAVAEGSIELERALRWEGPIDGDLPRPSLPRDVVAPPADPRVLRFTSHVGSGAAGILVRVVRPVIQPVVLVLKVGPEVHTYPFEEFLATRTVAGGWNLPAGQVEIDSAVPAETAGCYAQTGAHQGTWSYAAAPMTALESFTGTVTRADGTAAPVTFQAVALRGPYGSFTGTQDAAGAVVRGYYGRRFSLGDYAREGLLVGRVDSAAGMVEELFVSGYRGSGLVGSLAFRPLACDQLGASRRNPFRL